MLKVNITSIIPGFLVKKLTLKKMYGYIFSSKVKSAFHKKGSILIGAEKYLFSSAPVGRRYKERVERNLK